MILQSLSSETVISLSLTQLITVIVALVSVMGGVVAYVRKEQRKEDRLAMVEGKSADQDQRIVELTRTVQATNQQLLLLTQQVTTWIDALSKDRPGRSRTAKHPT